MNRIEKRMQELKEVSQKAFITYITAGLPNLEKTASILKAQEEAGIDVIELGIPFSDPTADGPVIQAASYEALQNGTNIKDIFKMVKQVRDEGFSSALIYMMYFNTVLHYGIEDFVDECIRCGVDGLIIPDLPYEEQEQLTKYLDREGAPILIQLVSPISKDRIPMITKNARGFIYCVSTMGVTGQGGSFFGEIHSYLESVKASSDIPVMMGFGIRTPQDIAPMADVIDGAIVGSHFIELMKEANFDEQVAQTYIRDFKAQMNQ